MVGIVILNFNNANDTINCIESIFKYNTYPIKIVVVDNGSTDNESVIRIDSYLKMKFGSNYIKAIENQNLSKLKLITFLVSSTNDGYACGNNKGLKLIFHDNEIEYVLILNSDVLFVEDILPRLIYDVNSLKDCGIVSPLLYKKGLKEIDRNCARNKYKIWDLIWINFPFPVDPFRLVEKHKMQISANSGIIPIELPSGSCMFCKKYVLFQIEGFDPNTFLYNEENILCEKINNLNLNSYLDTSIKCIHLGATSTKKISSAFVVKKYFESTEYFVNEYLKPSIIQKIILKTFFKLGNWRMNVISAIKNLSNIWKSSS